MKSLNTVMNTLFNSAYSWYEKRREKKSTIIFMYSISFFILFLLGYISFFKSGKSFVWGQNDGTTQHYPTLMYLGEYFRDIIKNILSGNFQIPMFDFNLGMGSDIIQTFNYYGLGDPLMLLSALVPVKQSLYLYNFLVVLRCYLAGLAFLYLCFYFRKSKTSSLIGALIYVFCGFAVFSGVRHPYFINPMIYLPLLIIGIDRVLKKQKPYLFIIMVFVSAMSGFYFFYMNTIFIFIYALVRFFDIEKIDRMKKLCFAFLRSTFYYIVGVLMSSVIFIPAVIGFLNSGRSKDSPLVSLLHFDFNTYKNIILRFVSPPYSWDYLGMGAISLFCIILMFTRKNKKHRILKILFLMLSIFSVVPFFGYMMNGFGYVTGRWTFGFALLISFIVVEFLPYIFEIKAKEKYILFFTVCIYGAICLSDSKTINIQDLFAFSMIALGFIIILLLKDMVNYKNNSIGYLTLFLFVCVNLILNCNFIFSPSLGKYTSQFENQNEVLNKVLNTPASSALPLQKGEFYRIDSSTHFVNNVSALLKYPGLTTYYSLINSSLADMHFELENYQAQPLFNISGIDYRSAIEALSSVKYFASETMRNDLIPFGYEEKYSKERGDKTDIVYENKYALPLGYTYSSYISEDEYSNLNGLEKQEAMLQSVALPKNIDGFTKGDLDMRLEKLDYTIENSSGVELKDGKLIISENNAKLDIKFKGLKNSETYVRFKNIQDDSSPFNFYINTEKVKRTVNVIEKQSAWYFGQNNYSVNLGYSEDSIDSITMTFPHPRTVNLSEIEIYSQPMDNYPKQIENLREEPLENIVVSTNKINGNVDLSSNKILTISIPWSSGWKAKVDGKNAEILKGNNAFMAIPLESGYHEISLSYITPGLKLGALSSVIGVFSFIAIIICQRRNKKQTS